jgi:Zn-dependent protease
VLFALAEPVAFVGLLVAFLLALVLRAVAIRLFARGLGLVDRRESLSPRLREDLDPFGAVAAAVGGTGWGKVIDVDEVPRRQGRGKAALVFAAGPIVTIVAAQIFFLIYSLLWPTTLYIYSPANVLQGQFTAPAAAQFVLGLATGLLCFGLLALIPVPPLDGFGLLWSAMRQPGKGMQGYRLWFQEKNIGVLVLLVCCFFPLGFPLLLIPINAVGMIFFRLWA